MDPAALGARIRALRKERRLTQQELAAPELTKSFISQLENGQVQPSLKTLTVLARRLEVSVGELLGTDEGHHTHAPQAAHLLRRAQELEAEGALAEAVGAYRDALDRLGGATHTDRGHASHALARLLFRMGRHEEAARHALQAESLLVLGGDRTAALEALNTLGACLRAAGRADAAHHCYERACLLLEEAGVEPWLRLRILCNAGILFAETGELAQAKAVLEEALRLSQSEQAFYKLGEVFQALGYIADKEGALDDACHFSERAVHFFRAAGDEPGLVHALLNLAIHHRRAGRLEAASQALAQATEAAGRSGSASLRARVVAEQGRLAWEQGDAAGARDRLVEALDSGGTPAERLRWRALLARAYRALGEPHSGEAALQAALDESADDARLQAGARAALGRLYAEDGYHEAACGHLLALTAICEREGFLPARDP